jgi:hypothetical protein
MPIDNYQNADYKDADDRGRVTLGTEHANSKVAVAWTEVEAPDPSDVTRPTDAERDKLTELWKWADKHEHKALDFDVQNGRVYTEDAEWVDTDVEGLVDE